MESARGFPAGFVLMLCSRF